MSDAKSFLSEESSNTKVKSWKACARGVTSQHTCEQLNRKQIKTCWGGLSRTFLWGREVRIIKGWANGWLVWEEGLLFATQAVCLWPTCVLGSLSCLNILVNPTVRYRKQIIEKDLPNTYWEYECMHAHPVKAWLRLQLLPLGDREWSCSGTVLYLSPKMIVWKVFN